MKKDMALIGAIGLAFLGEYDAKARCCPDHGRSANNPLKTGNRKDLRAKRKAQRQAKKRSTR